ncbi:carbohydrate ABC transporter permease [Lachnotalea sp. AF33-28]|uniref:carbohydrate ABC transporter permease n=1 Tax=Lachnotalea sp. AF33-28 TaxID=2292046 RepID=UPI000E4F0905|nr:carbohydrate ABC transporter permease [Lachnotalea sp. AF33-28]RHP30064.1 carbohydrate ABC transporter permease [Lachnotalea sp. AF33-28]
MAGSKNSSNHIKRSPGDQTVQVLIYIFIGAFAIACVVPFIYVFAGSFATEKELTERPFFLIPHEFSLNAYRYVTKTGDVFFGLKNSLIVTAVGVIINMFFTTTFAYPLSRPYLRGRNGFINIVIITMLFGGGMIPAYLLVSSLNLLDTYWALWLPGAISAFNFIIVKNYFQGLPMELEEAAKIDGSSDIGIFTRIILPLSKPVLASVSLFYMVGHWNSYFSAMLYIRDQDKEVVQIVLRRIAFLAGGINTDGTPIDYGLMGAPPEKAVRMAITVVATVPILIVYPFIQKYFTKGVMVGAVKG